MLGDALYLARRDIRYMFREKATWLWTFVMPVVFFYFIGTITSGFRGPTDTRDPIAVSAPPDAGFLAGHVERRMEALQFRLVRVKSPEELARYRRRLVFPPGFTASVLAGKPMKIQFQRTGSGQDADYDQIRLSRAVYSVLADLLVLAKDGKPVDQLAVDRLEKAPRHLTLEVKPAGRRLEPPTGFEQAVPGTMVMFTLLVLFTTGGISLAIERNQGILRRLASAPISRPSVVLAKWMARLVVGIVQIAFALAAGSILFGVKWGSNLPALALVLLAYAALATSLGMILGNFLRTEQQIVGVGVLSTNVMAALGGCWWPIEITPAWMQKLALAFPTGWTMDAMHKLVSFGEPGVAVLPHVVVLAAAALAAGWVVARSFRFQ